jgi:excinuclease ABC subunit C
MLFDSRSLSSYPSSPAVYIMKNEKNIPLYIGKAKNVKKRLQQYFSLTDTRATVLPLIQQVSSIDYILVTTEKEALILENTLIKKHQPKYNLLLKDDKTFISLMLTDHLWPTIKVARYKGKAPNDKNEYFGPYTSSDAAKEVLDLIFQLFSLRQCSDSDFFKRKRPCILYDVKRCSAPCVSLCNQEEYKNQVEKAAAFLRGQNHEVVKKIKNDMLEASKNLEFEKADYLLKLLKKIEHVLQKQHVETFSEKNFDVLGFFQKESHFLITVLSFREGKLIGSEHFSFFDLFVQKEEIFSSFLLQHYQRSFSIPEEIILPIDLPQKTSLEEVFFETFHKKVSLIFPQKGKKQQFVQMALDNAKSLFSQEEDLFSHREKLLLELKETCLLENFPKTIYCFDTAFLFGSDPVASKIVFSSGEKDKSQTRLFSLKTAKSDYPGIKEVLYRALSKEKTFPDLIIVDGGKGQLSVALTVLQELNIASIDVLALAKEDQKHTRSLTQEAIYIKQQKEPIILKKTSSLLFFLQKIRDEAHRVAIGYHRRKREKRTISSELDSLPGIGPKKRKDLLQTFGSVEKIKKASEKDLLQIKTLSKKDRKNLLNWQKKKKNPIFS